MNPVLVLFDLFLSLEKRFVQLVRVYFWPIFFSSFVLFCESFFNPLFLFQGPKVPTSADVDVEGR
jgi:hypothetical protein